MKEKGTEENPFKISCAEDLHLIRENRKAHFVLTDDINIKGSFLPNCILKIFPDDSLWSLETLGVFKGYLDGQGHTIRGLRLAEYSEFPSGRSCSIGLFDYNIGTIENLNVDCILVSGENKTRIIAGVNKGKIRNCSARGKVTGKKYVGGITGQNEGTISECSFSGKIKTYCYSGGIAGKNSGIISESSSEFSIYGEKFLGGITSLNKIEGKIKSSSSVCAFRGRYFDFRNKTPFSLGKGRVGGISSTNYGLVKDSYCEVKKSTIKEPSTSGLVGKNSGKLKNCYLTNSSRKDISLIQENDIGVRNSLEEAQKSVVVSQI